MLYSICQLKRVPSDGENRVRRLLVEFLAFNSVYWKISAPSNGRNRVRRRLVEVWCSTRFAG